MSVRAADQQAGQPLAGDLAMLTKGVVADNQLRRDMVQRLRELKAWLLDMAERAAATDCSLAEEVAAVRIPVIVRTADETSESASEDEDGQLEAAVQQLAKLIQRYLISCVCAALNPPCPNCTDDAVLLAGIDVLDCEVQSICQVVRRNVLSGPGLRYWLGLNRIPGLLEQVCCAEDLCVSWGDGGGEVPPRLVIGEPAFLPTAQTAAIGEPARVLIAVAQAMAGQDTRAARLLGRALNPAQLRTDLAKWATGSPQVREVVGPVAVQAVKDAVAEQATQIAGQADRLIQLEATLQGRLQDLEEQVADIEQLRDDLVQFSSPSAPETGSPGEPDTPSATAPRAATKKAPAKKAPAKKAAPRTTRKGPQ
jgi:hypothetical protein